MLLNLSPFMYLSGTKMNPLYFWLYLQANPSGNEDKGPLPPGLMLKYSAHTNLAGLYKERGELNKAMENYLEVKV